VLGRLVPSSTSRAVVERWNSVRPTDELLAPPLLFAECTSVLSENVHRKLLPEPHARFLVEAVSRLPLRIIDAPVCYPRAFDIARSLGWAKAYDALYLAAAEYEAAELLTVDRGMHDAAVRVGIQATLVR